jgi:hypothetical protein
MASVTLPSDPISTRFPTIGSVISAALPYVYVFAGLIMLIMLITGGITLMTSAGDPGKTKSGMGKIQGGIVGFLIIFISYFVVQIVQVVLGVKIF